MSDCSPHTQLNNRTAISSHFRTTRHELHPNNIWKQSSYITNNIPRLHYKYHRVMKVGKRFLTGVVIVQNNYKKQNFLIFPWLFNIFSSIFCSLKAHYRVHISTTHFPTLSELKALTSISPVLKIHSKMFFSSTSRSSKRTLCLRSLHQTQSLLHHASCFAQLLHIHLVTLITFGEEQRQWISLLCSILQCLVTSCRFVVFQIYWNF
jgi:hypothetical protein